MKQKIVIRISMHDDKSRSKALKVAVSIPGVESVAVAGEEKDQVVVVGDGIDSVKLTQRLRKKIGMHAELLSVGAVESEQPSPPAVVEEPPPPVVGVGVVATPYCGIPHYHHYEVREPSCYNPCAIM